MLRGYQEHALVPDATPTGLDISTDVLVGDSPLAAMSREDWEPGRPAGRRLGGRRHPAPGLPRRHQLQDPAAATVPTMVLPAPPRLRPCPQRPGPGVRRDSLVADCALGGVRSLVDDTVDLVGVISLTFSAAVSTASATLSACCPARSLACLAMSSIPMNAPWSWGPTVPPMAALRTLRFARARRVPHPRGVGERAPRWRPHTWVLQPREPSPTSPWDRPNADRPTAPGIRFTVPAGMTRCDHAASHPGPGAPWTGAHRAHQQPSRRPARRPGDRGSRRAGPAPFGRPVGPGGHSHRSAAGRLHPPLRHLGDRRRRGRASAWPPPMQGHG